MVLCFCVSCSELLYGASLLTESVDKRLPQYQVAADVFAPVSLVADRHLRPTAQLHSRVPPFRYDPKQGATARLAGEATSKSGEGPLTKDAVEKVADRLSHKVLRGRISSRRRQCQHIK
jgi:hypothetical protein